MSARQNSAVLVDTVEIDLWFECDLPGHGG
jgi:hypothetical protein